MASLNLILVGSEDGKIYAIDPQTMESRHLPFDFDAPILASMYADQERGILFFHAQDGTHTLYALKIEPDGTATKLWDYQTGK